MSPFVVIAWGVVLFAAVRWVRGKGGPDSGKSLLAVVIFVILTTVFAWTMQAERGRVARRTTNEDANMWVDPLTPKASRFTPPESN